jgi:hypothetical protein
VITKNCLKGKNILLISPESWGVNYLSKHHFAIELSKSGNHVFFLNPPARLKRITNVGKNLRVVDYKPTFRGLRKLPKFISGILIKREIESLERWLKIDFDIIWNFDSSRFFNLKRIKNKYKIAHIVDWSENFNRRLLCESADLCLCTSEFLKKEMVKSNPNTYKIGHGYRLSEYDLSQSERKSLHSRFHYKAGYAGNLNFKLIDWQIIYELIIQNPKVGFYFIGPTGTSNLSGKNTENQHLDKIQKLKNVFFLGEMASYKLSAYLSEFDILLLVYKGIQYKQQLANPHKMLEYLGSGKVIVASWTEEYKDIPDLIEMVENNAKLLNKFSEVLSHLEFYNHEEKQLKRKSFASEELYDKKISSIERLIHDSFQKG